MLQATDLQDNFMINSSNTRYSHIGCCLPQLSYFDGTENTIFDKNTLECGMGHWNLFLLGDSSGSRGWILNLPVFCASLFCLKSLWWMRHPGCIPEHCAQSQEDCSSIPCMSRATIPPARRTRNTSDSSVNKLY